MAPNAGDGGAVRPVSCPADTIIPKCLYLGSVNAFRHLPVHARDDGVALVVRCIPDQVNFPEDAARALAEQAGVALHVVPVEDSDGEDIHQYFSAATAAMHAVIAGGKAVLVHCIAGRSRSPTIVAAYVMRYVPGKRAVADALGLVRAGRSRALPNDGFCAQLRRWEMELNAGDAAAAA